MPLTSYRVGSPVYIAPPSHIKVSPAKIPKEKIVSMQGLKNTESSWPYDQSMPSRPHIFSDGHGHGFAVRRTSNKLHGVSYNNFSKYGDFSPQLDDTMGFGSWKDAGEKYGPNHFEYVKLPSTSIHSGVVESFRQKPSYFDVRDTWIPKFSSDLYISETHLNKTGKRVSEIENLRQHLTNYFGTPVARELAQDAMASGKSLEDIGYIGAGHLPKEAAYGVARMSDGRVVVLAGYAYDAIAKTARRWGLDVKTYLETMMAEEHQHIIRKSFDKPNNEDDFVAEEEITKDGVSNAYSRLAKGAEGGNPRNPRYEQRRRNFKIQSGVKLHDRDTADERYRGLYRGDKAEMRLMLEMDAIEKGLRGEAVTEYVEGRLSQMDGAESPRMSRLERIAEEKPAPKEAPEAAE